MPPISDSFLRGETGVSGTEAGVSSRIVGSGPLRSPSSAASCVNSGCVSVLVAFLSPLTWSMFLRRLVIARSSSRCSCAVRSSTAARPKALASACAWRGELDDAVMETMLLPATGSTLISLSSASGDSRRRRSCPTARATSTLRISRAAVVTSRVGSLARRMRPSPRTVVWSSGTGVMSMSACAS